MSLTMLTGREARILRYIRRYVARYECGPTLREIAERFGIPSLRRVAADLDALQKKGCIRWTPGLARSIELAGVHLGPRHVLWNLLGEIDQTAWQAEPKVATLCHR